MTLSLVLWIIDTPTGNLREPRLGKERADIIVVTKCPNGLSDAEKQKIVSSITSKNKQHVFFSYINYAEGVVSYKKRIRLNSLQHFTLVTGIANSNPLVDFLTSKKLDFKHLDFKDHHEF